MSLIDYSIKNFNKIILGILFINIASIPFNIQLHSVSLSTLAVLLLAKEKCSGCKNNQALFVLVPLLTLEGLSIFYSTNNASAVNYLILHGSFILYPIIFSSIEIKPKTYKKVLQIFFVSCIIFCLQINLSILYHIASNSEPITNFLFKYIRFNLMKQALFSIHPPYWGIYLNFCLALTLFQWKELFLNKYRLFLILYLFMNIYLCSSQMTTFISLSLLYYFLGSKALTFIKREQIKVIVLTIPLLSTLFFLVIFNDSISNFLYEIGDGYNKQHITNRIAKTLSQGDYIRVENWNSCLELIKDNILLGVGIGDSKKELLNYRDPNSWNYTAQVNSHNQYLGILVKTGIIGLILFMIPIIFSFYKFYKSKCYIGLIFLVICLLAMITENILDRQKGVVFFTLFLIFFLKTSQRTSFKNNIIETG